MLVKSIRFVSYGKRYYQITAIDEYSRKRVLKIVKEKNTYETSQFLKELEHEMGFKIHTIQVDNGYEFVNDPDKCGKETLVQKCVTELELEIKRIRSYSSWQIGNVERSYRKYFI